MCRDYGDTFSSSVGERRIFWSLYNSHNKSGIYVGVYCKAIRRTQIHHLLGLILRMQVLQLSKLINYFSNNALICASVLA